MRARTVFGMCGTVLLTFAFSVLATSCEATDKDAIEYVNKEVAYLDGDSCVERYLLYEEDGEYERYIAGTYYGQEVPGIYFGTLFETGTYAVTDSADETAQKITFSPKKQYDFCKEQLVNLGLEGQLPYYGTLTDTTLTITWGIWEDYYSRRVKRGDVSIIYKRK